MDRKPNYGSCKLFRRRGVIIALCLIIFAPLILWQRKTGSESDDQTVTSTVSTIFDNLEFKIAPQSIPAGLTVEGASWKAKHLEEIQGLDQKDKKLIRLVRQNFIELPSKLEYSFGKDTTLGYVDAAVDKALYPLFKNKTNGFFVEVGAYDGLYSHTLILEKDYKWRGLLIECNPQLLPSLRSVHRKAYISDVCLSRTNHPAKTKMTSMDKWLASSSLGSGSLSLFPSYIKSNYTSFEVQTIPLYTIIASIDIAVVDLIVLDVQSLELDVLKYFPFNLISVKVWLVEVFFFSDKQKDALLTFMAQNGYPTNRVVKLDMDFIFIHNSLQ